MCQSELRFIATADSFNKPTRRVVVNHHFSFPIHNDLIIIIQNKKTRLCLKSEK